MAVVRGGELGEVIVDGGESAKDLNRPGVAKLLALVEAGKVEAVIVAKLDRLRRSVKDLCGLLERLRSGRWRPDIRCGVAGYRLGGGAPGDLNDHGRGEPMGTGSDRRTDPRRPPTQTQPGRRVGNIAFGFRLGSDGEHLEPDPAEQSALAEIRRLRVEGLTLRGIAASLNHRAVRTRRGTPWRLESVARVVKQAIR